jgi:hypothetical protein
MKKSAAAFMGRILPVSFVVWLAVASLAVVSFAVILIAQAPFAPPIEAQPSGEARSLKEPGPKEPGQGSVVEGRWVPGHHFSISMGCLKKWICDCSMVEPPRGARIERTPSESIAGICERGSCTVCTAGPPEKKCACKTKPR